MTTKPNTCYNCGHDLSKGGHFVPPSFGDEGFYACKAFCPECQRIIDDATEESPRVAP